MNFAAYLDTGGHNVSVSVEFSPKKPNEPDVLTNLRAVLKIQKVFRNVRCWKIAVADHHWKLFCELDTHVESDMLELSSFMQTIMHIIPNTNSWRERLEVFKASKEEDELHLGEIHITSIRSNSIATILSGSDDYEILDDITPTEVKCIMDLYRNQGKLSLPSVRQILRNTYKCYQSLTSNITYVSITNQEKVNVVGDIHGQIQDLLYILDSSGEPGPHNKYIFNGDFVDRGNNSLEVICLLFAMRIAYPNDVILNRGNHEDHSICTVYGFQKECRDKYDMLTFGMFTEVFRYLPLFAIINHAVFVVHGGLFHRPGVTLAELNEIRREDYIPKPTVPYPDCTVGLTIENARKEYLKQLQREALWSDPMDSVGCFSNKRGAGVQFGYDVVQDFLLTNNLKMVVRSHECVRSGFDLPFTNSAARHLICTVFSASNYCNSDNDGSYVVFTAHAVANASPVVGSDLWFYVAQYKTSDAATALETSNIISMRGLIIKKRSALYQSFLAADTENTGWISKGVWSEIMARVTDLRIRWCLILPSLSEKTNVTANGLVQYQSFLNSFMLDSELSVIDTLYAQRPKLEAIFNYFDSDANGMISRSEFRQGCELLNEILPVEEKLNDTDRILDLMDFDKSDTIDINEFFEVLVTRCCCI